MEEWATIPKFPLYEVSSTGLVRNRGSGRILRLQKTQSGGVFVGMLDEEGYQKQRGLARLVARAFIPQDLPSFDTPINVNGDRWNCGVDNLMWRPRWFAIQYHLQFKRRYPYPIDSPMLDVGSGEVYHDSWEVVRMFGLLEKELVAATQLRTYVWPTYQVFEVVD